MSIDVRVPTTGNAGEEAVVVEWNVAVGTRVSAGDVLVTLETAKATIDVEAPADGELLQIVHEAGAEVPEHEVLAIIGEAGEVVDGPVPPLSTQGELPDAATGAVPAGPATASAPVPAAAGARTDTPASPRARTLAGRNDISLAGLTGSGPGGRIIVSDVIAALADRRATGGGAVADPAPVATTPSAVDGDTPYDTVPVRGARKVTAQRMHASLQESAQLTLTRYADGSALLDWVARLRVETDRQGLPKVTVNDAVLYATARALATHPEANSAFSFDGIRQYRRVDLGFAVDTGAALLVPVIRGADTLGLGELAAESRRLIERAKSGALTNDEMSGGTFTVSNLGALGIHWFTPVLNPPQSGILGIGAAHQSYPEGPRLLPLSYTFDHRALDGAAAAAVLADIARAIETVDLLTAL